MASDLVGFCRPRLSECLGKHDQSTADQALPAGVLAVVAAVGSLGTGRLPLVRLILRPAPDDPRAVALQRRAITQAAAALQPDEALLVDAGCGVAALLAAGATRLVARVARTFTARRQVLSVSTGRGRGSLSGERVRPWPRTHQGKTMAATPPDATAQWGVGGRRIQAQIWDNLVLSTSRPGGTACRSVVLHDPRSQAPLVLATTFPVSASALWRLSRDRWPIAQVPLAAKPRLGAHRAFVFGSERRSRLPALALVAGHILASVAATAAAVATSLGDRHCRPTCGRVRRLRWRVDVCAIPVPEGGRAFLFPAWRLLPARPGDATTRTPGSAGAAGVTG